MSIGLLAVHNHYDLGTEWCANGYNPAVGGTFESLWAHGAVHTELAAAAALHMSSSSDSDTFNVEIKGLDANWTPQTVTKALAGKTETVVGTTETWIRVFSIRNVSATPAVGDVYVYLDDTVAAGIPQTQAKIQLKMLIGYEKSMCGRLSVPADNAGRIVQWGGFVAAAAAAEINLMYRPFGEVAEVLRIMSVYFNGHLVHLVMPIECGAKSDVFLRAKGGGAVSGIICGYIEPE